MDSGANNPIYKNVLDNVEAGVLTITLQGEIVTLNPAGSTILGLVAEDVVGRPFAEIFLHEEGKDPFTDAVLAAIKDPDTNQQRVVEISDARGPRSLSLTTSYLRDDKGGGVIAVFSDITEVRELRESELRLGQSLREQNEELQEAYRSIEERSDRLAATLKRGRIATISAAALLVLAVGLFWEVATQQEIEVEDNFVEAEAQAVPASRRRIYATVSVSGKLAPGREMEITAPFAGEVVAVHVGFGDQVSEGQKLVELDTTDIMSKYRTAQASHINALKRYNEVKHWEDGTEVSSLRRSVASAKTALDAQRVRMQQTELLLAEGVIAANDHNSNLEQYENQRASYEGLLHDLEAARARGGEKELRVAELELANARIEMDNLKLTLDQATVVAPVRGVVLETQSGGEGRGDKQRQLVAGATTSEGQSLMVIGDLTSLSVDGSVDEVDITKIRVDHPVTVTGDAFPELKLKGRVTQVSSQARLESAGRGQLPTYRITVTLDSLTESERNHLRVGMSANLDIVIYDNPEALIVPLHAVHLGPEGSRLRVRDPDTGEIREVAVETGVTTLSGVEILNGIQVGDEVMVGTSRAAASPSAYDD